MITFALITRIVVGGFLAAAGLAKLVSTPAWRQEWLGSYRIVPARLVRLAAYLLALAELVTGIVVFGGAFGRLGPIAAIALLALVTLAVASTLIRGLRPSCGCLGKAGGLISWRIVTRNLVLLGATFILATRGPSAPNLNRHPWEVQVVIVLAVLLLAAIAIGRGRRIARDHEPVNNNETLSPGARHAALPTATPTM